MSYAEAFDKLVEETRQFESALGIDMQFRLRMMTLLMALFKEKELAYNAYWSVLSEALDIQKETSYFLDTADGE